MIYQIFTSVHNVDQPELRSLIITTPLTFDQLEPELLKISQDGSLYNWVKEEKKFDIYEEPNGIKMCYTCQDDGMTIVAEYNDDVQHRDFVTKFFTELSDAEQALEVIQSIPLQQAMVMTIQAVASKDSFLDFIREKHRIERCHFVMR